MTYFLRFTKSKMQMIVLLFVLFSFFNLNAQYERKVIFEEFSEVWCGPCAQLAPTLSKWLDNHPEYLAIYYYSYFVIDGKQVMTNKEDYSARNQFYAVPFYPYARINAILAPNDAYPGFPTDTNLINKVIDTMTKTTPVKLEIVQNVSGTILNAKISISSNIALNNKNLYVMLVEKERNYAAQSNGQTHFHHIFRKSLSAPTGDQFSMKSGEQKEFNYNFDLKDYLGNEMIVTAIVQDPLIRYLYQAESSKISSAICFEIDKNNDNINVSPNPVNEFFNVQLSKEDEFIEKIELLDLLGNNIGVISLDYQTNKVYLSKTDFNSKIFNYGVFILKVSTNNNIYTDKIIFE